MPLKSVSIFPLPKSWLRIAVLAMVVGLVTIVSGQLSLAYAQNTQQTPAKAQKKTKKCRKVGRTPKSSIGSNCIGNEKTNSQVFRS